MMNGEKGRLSGLIALLAFTVIIVAVVIYYTSSSKTSDAEDLVSLKVLQTEFMDGSVCFNEGADCFDIAIADDDKERARGLMYYENLKSSEGMLFIFDEEGEHAIWMKNMLMPLDMIWINEIGEIVFMYQNAQPCPADAGVESYCPSIINNNNKPAKYVLEVNAGAIQSIELREGDRIAIRMRNV